MYVSKYKICINKIHIYRACYINSTCFYLGSHAQLSCTGWIKNAYFY